MKRVSTKEIWEFLNTHRDDVVSENDWLIGALRHAMAMLDIAQTYHRETANEWREIDKCEVDK